MSSFHIKNFLVKLVFHLKKSAYDNDCLLSTMFSGITRTLCTAVSVELTYIMEAIDVAEK